MDNNIIIEMVKQVPALTCLCGLVFMFLKNASKTQDSYLSAATQARQEFLASLRQQQNENLEAHKATREVIKESTLVQIKLTDAINALTTETRLNTAKLDETHNRG